MWIKKGEYKKYDSKKCFSKKNDKIKILREEMWVKNVRLHNMVLKKIWE